MTEKQIDILKHIAEEGGNTNRATLDFLFGKSYGRIVGSLVRMGYVYWYRHLGKSKDDELWLTKEGWENVPSYHNR